MTGLNTLTSSLSALGLLLLLVVMCSTARGGNPVATIHTGTLDSYAVDCTALAGGIVQQDYGWLTMSSGGMDSYAVSVVDPLTSEIDCSFLYTHEGTTYSQTFPVFSRPISAGGSTVNCGTDCQWTVTTSDGFLLLDPLTNTDVPKYPWLKPVPSSDGSMYP